ncbi:phasin family protein [Shewanella psychropiezotolerans]|uniref:Phasin family protein n=1 Tax=Shewanella psychropiezotolerans TaxID=2593655 RepID=A0ABX5X3X5_9GAMM|nr:MULTISPECIES: phasin family protein [Shewanella]MPY25567.1 phasin family protein [Shewanella sp. YLB-07]QDO86055.1 phasin family protein [Shewanella psychropiezotolerans]
MNQEMFKSFNDQLQQVFAPLNQFNQLVAENIEQLSRIQLESLKAYSTLGNEQVKSATSISDGQSLATHGSKQLELITKVSQQLMEDSQKFTQIGQSFKQAADQYVNESTKAAKPAK